MDRPFEWRFWSAEQIAEALPELLATVESRLAEFPEEHREKNRAAVLSLKADPPTPAQVRDGSRSRDLVTLGFALDALGRRAAGTGQVEESLQLFQAAHELFRGGNPLLRATKPMRQTLSNALKGLALRELDRIRAGQSHAGAIREQLRALVTSAWGVMPPQLALGIDELIFTELERFRAAGEGDPGFQERIIRDNIETVLTMDIPTRLERVRRRWEEIGAQVAPAAALKAQRTLRRPEDLSAVAPPAVWSAIQQAVERGDVEALGHSLEEVADDLEMNLRLRLDAKADYREPASELRAGGGPDAAFVEARGLLLRQDPGALEQFNNIHYRRSSNTIAKEWYAYALTLFGRATDIHDVIELLEDAIASEHHRPDRGWTARWNLACALRRLPSRAPEALDVLLPVLELDAHTSEVFELCLLWALEQGRQDVLGTLFLKSRYYEAHLLAALQDVEALREGGPQSSFRDHFRRINRILRDPDRVFPDPKERLTFGELDQLTRDFIETSLIAAGVEWFRQRVSYGSEGRVFKNWECAALLNEAAGDLAAAWRCRQQSWRATQHKKNVDPRRKTQVLRALLIWGQRTGFQDDALRILKQSWRDTSMSDADARIWEERLGPRGRLGEPDVPPREAEGDDGSTVGGAPAAGAALSPAERAATLPGRRLERGSDRPSGTDASALGRQPLALMLDWENVKISLAELLEEMPEAKVQGLRARLSGAELAARLRDAAWRHGLPRQRWAVADWDRPFFEGDQKAVKSAGYFSDIAGHEKFNSSDHVLREKIHLVLREHPEISLYIIGTGDGDFHEAIKTLQQQGKQVILWSTRRAVNGVYGESLKGPERIQIEWLEDIVFGNEAAP
ncbi:MAG: NYN domain-containing protein [Candidatus Rokubacteria bacterium]|nr:NYN domain-containing protein [Candidatus Rokubacteria bacterium]